MKVNFSLAALAATLAATVECRAGLPPRAESDPPAKALYFVTNMQPYGQVAALPIAANGSIAGPGTLTQLGSNGPLSDQNLQNQLSAQYAIKIVDNLLFAVSGGSNTVSMFEISRSDPTNLTRIGDAVPTGPFPISVAVLAAQNLVCVGVADSVTAGASCATYSPTTGIGKMDAVRPYFSSQNPPPASGQFNEVGTILFNDEGTALFTAVKGNLEPDAPGIGNFLSAFPVLNGSVSRTQIVSYPDNVGFLYGSQFIPGTAKILTTDLSGAAVFSVNSSFQTDSTAFNTRILNNTCTCWTAVSATTRTGFVTDPIQARLTEIDLDTGAIVKALLVEPATRLLDLAAAGGRLYVLTLGDLENVPAKVAVFDVSGGRGTFTQIQNFNPLAGTANSAGISASSQGMALFFG